MAALAAVGAVRVHQDKAMMVALVALLVVVALVLRARQRQEHGQRLVLVERGVLA